MALLARRLWSELKTEFIRSAGGVNYSSFSSRAEQFLNDAYLDICLTYHHYELDTAAEQTLAENTSTLVVPPNCYIIIGVLEINALSGSAASATSSGEVVPPSVSDEPPGGQPIKYLQNQSHAIQQGLFTPTMTGSPAYYSRRGNVLYLNIASDAERFYRVIYYRYPTPPDFAATATSGDVAYPETGWLWDEHILEKALIECGVKTWDTNLTTMNAQLLQTFLDDQVQPSLVGDPVADLPLEKKANRPLGAAQG